MVGYRVQVDGSGRTDSGVHARGQVASVKLSKLYDVEDLKDALNRSLPEDIRIIRGGTGAQWIPRQKEC